MTHGSGFTAKFPWQRVDRRAVMASNQVAMDPNLYEVGGPEVLRRWVVRSPLWGSGLVKLNLHGPLCIPTHWPQTHLASNTLVRDNWCQQSINQRSQVIQHV
jgi:hypothetical protein